jgi:hypothetical protein
LDMGHCLFNLHLTAPGNVCRIAQRHLASEFDDDALRSAWQVPARERAIAHARRTHESARA